jgi:hypothetical protein
MELSNAITDNLVAAMEDAVTEHGREIFGTIAGDKGNTTITMFEKVRAAFPVREMR